MRSSANRPFSKRCSNSPSAPAPLSSLAPAGKYPCRIRLARELSSSTEVSSGVENGCKIMGGNRKTSGFGIMLAGLSRRFPPVSVIDTKDLLDSESAVDGSLLPGYRRYTHLATFLHRRRDFGALRLAFQLYLYHHVE